SFFFSSRRRHTSFSRDWSSDVCSSDLTRLGVRGGDGQRALLLVGEFLGDLLDAFDLAQDFPGRGNDALPRWRHAGQVFATAREEIGRASCRARRAVAEGGGGRADPTRS